MAPYVAALNDARVYALDLPLLSPFHWLNDNLVTFYAVAIMDTCQHPPSLIDPSVGSFMMHQLDPDDEDYESECATFLKNVDNDIVVLCNSSFASSTAQFQKVDSGVHWSLLHMTITASSGSRTVTATHHDSSPSFQNTLAATAFVTKFTHVLATATPHLPFPSSTFRNAPTHKQTDGWSCGWFTLEFLTNLLRPGETPDETPYDVNEQNANTKKLFNTFLETHSI